MLIKLDRKILNFIQSWLCDPLQFCGMSIDTQCRILTVGILLGMISLLCFCVLAGKMFSACLYGLVIPLIILQALKENLAEFLRNANLGLPAYGFAFLTLAFCLLGSLSIIMSSNPSTRDIFTQLFLFCIVLREYVSRCKPKPPTRVQVLESSTV